MMVAGSLLSINISTVSANVLGGDARHEYLSPEDLKQLEAMEREAAGLAGAPLHYNQQPHHQEAQEQAKQPDPQQGDMSIFYGASDEEIAEMREKARKMRRLLEGDVHVAPKSRTIVGGGGSFPEIRLIKGFATAIHLPYNVNPNNIAIGNAKAFNVVAQGSTLVVFPLQHFRTTNMIVFDENGNAHQYILTEDLSADSVDLAVNVVQSKQIPDFRQVITRSIISGDLPHSGTLQSMAIADRNPKMTVGHYPIIRKIRLTGAWAETVYLLEGVYIPVGNNTKWYSHIDNRRTIVAVTGDSINIRRVRDGRIINIR
jgi:hypothetical protein